MTTPIISCINCRYLYLTKKRTCEAFPKGIPTEILIGENSHRKPFDGDNGIRWEKVKDTKDTANK